MRAPTYGALVTALAGGLALCAASGCVAPKHAIPTERTARLALPAESSAVQFGADGRLQYGRVQTEPNRWDEVLVVPVRGGAGLIRRAGRARAPKGPAMRPLRFQRDAQVEVGFVVGWSTRRARLKPAGARRLEDMLAMLHPSFPLGATEREWLTERVEVDPLRAALGRQLAELRAVEPPAAPSLLEAAFTAWRHVEGTIDAPEEKLRDDSRFIAGLVGWERGAYSGYSWSVPLHFSRHDERIDKRDLFVIPALTGGSSDEAGTTALSVPLLGYWSRNESLDERWGGWFLLGAGHLYREDAKRGRRELDVWPAGSLVVHRQRDQTVGFSLPTLGFYLRQGYEGAHQKRWLVLPPLLAASYRYQTPGTADDLAHDRSFYFGLGPLVVGDRSQLGQRERHRTLLVPLLGYRETEVRENVPAGTEVVQPRSQSSTHLLGSLVHWGSERRGRYRPAGIEGAPVREVGRDRSSWRFLPLASYQSAEEDDRWELMLWPLLGLGFGSEEGEGYVRLLYFVKL